MKAIITSIVATAPAAVAESFPARPSHFLKPCIIPSMAGVANKIKIITIAQIRMPIQTKSCLKKSKVAFLRYVPTFRDEFEIKFFVKVNNSVLLSIFPPFNLAGGSLDGPLGRLAAAFTLAIGFVRVHGSVEH